MKKFIIMFTCLIFLFLGMLLGMTISIDYCPSDEDKTDVVTQNTETTINPQEEKKEKFKKGYEFFLSSMEREIKDDIDSYNYVNVSFDKKLHLVIVDVKDEEETEVTQEVKDRIDRLCGSTIFYSRIKIAEDCDATVRLLNQDGSVKYTSVNGDEKITS